MATGVSSTPAVDAAVKRFNGVRAMNFVFTGDAGDASQTVRELEAAITKCPPEQLIEYARKRRGRWFVDPPANREERKRWKAAFWRAYNYARTRKLGDGKAIAEGMFIHSLYWKK